MACLCSTSAPTAHAESGVKHLAQRRRKHGRRLAGGGARAAEGVARRRRAAAAASSTGLFNKTRENLIPVLEA